MLLRSALYTSYPIAASKSKLPAEERVGAAISRGAKGYGASSTQCTTTRVTETVTRKLIEVVNVWKTKEKRFRECYDREISKNPCKSAPIIRDPLVNSVIINGPDLCAKGFCVAQGFVDIVVSVIEIVTTFAEEVTREVVSCVVIPKKGEWLNPWNLSDLSFRAVVPQPAQKFSQKNIDDALNLLKGITGFLGVFGDCLLKGTWSLAQLDTRLNLGGENIVIPYGVKVCLDSACATRLSVDNVFLAGIAAWGSALTVLAALSPKFLTVVSTVSLGSGPLITVPASIATIVAAASPPVVAVAAIILAFIMLALIWGTAISFQLAFHRRFTDNFADGSVCIEHPTFAIALIEIGTLGLAPLDIIPPYVTG